MERKRVSPGFAILVHNIQYPFLLPPAIKLTRHIFDWGRQHTVFRTIRDGRLRKRKSIHLALPGHPSLLSGIDFFSLGT